AIVAVVWLALDRRYGSLPTGKSQLAGAYPASLVALAMAVLQLVKYLPISATVPPLEALLIGISLSLIAIRHDSPWPTYGGCAMVMLAASGLPAAVGLDVSAWSSAKACGVVMVV